MTADETAPTLMSAFGCRTTSAERPTWARSGRRNRIYRLSVLDQLRASRDVDAKPDHVMKTARTYGWPDSAKVPTSSGHHRGSQNWRATNAGAKLRTAV